MCEFYFLYLHDLIQETPKDMKKKNVNRSLKEPVPKRAKIASDIQGHYFLLTSRDCHQDALGHIVFEESTCQDY